MTRQALDFSYARPSADAILGVGINEVLVYCGNARPDQAYIDSLRSRGITVTYIMETVSTRSQQGFQAGSYDRAFAESRSREQGHTGSIAVVVSDGNGADSWDASEYGRGWAEFATLPFFAYGAVPICESFARGAHGLCLGSWVPITWGMGTLISQLVTPSPIADTDLNIVHADYTVSPAPTPAPEDYWEEEDTMLIIKRGTSEVAILCGNHLPRKIASVNDYQRGTFVTLDADAWDAYWQEAILLYNAAVTPTAGGGSTPASPLNVTLSGTATPV